MRARFRLRAIARAWCLRHAPRLLARWGALDDAELGLLGEELAARALLDAGFTILGRRVRTREAEVDVLALDGATLVCVEVKAARFEPVPIPRGADPACAALGRERFRPGARCDAARIERLTSAARRLARARGRLARVDLVEVWVAGPRGAVSLRHARDVSEPVS